jgi:M-phase inducer tyrosine phosphatase
VNTPPVDIDTAGTPPIMSSSPYVDAMDISPLPHKVPRFVAQVTLPSPTPETTPDDADSNLTTPDLLTPEESFEPAAQTVHAVQPPSYLALPE